MKIGVVGGRYGVDIKFVFEHLRQFIKSDDTIISGGAQGVDTFAIEYAKYHNIFFHIFPPLEDDIAKGLNPYHERNTRIANECDILLAFPSKTSVGTWDTVSKAISMNKRVMVIQ